MKLTRFFVIAATMMIAIVTVSAHDFEVDGIYYDITSSTDFTVEVTYRGGSHDSYLNDYVGVVRIPQSVKYSGNTYRVISIGTRAFKDCSDVTSIIIPKSVISIDNYAFSGCVSLKKITIEDGNEILEIGYNEYVSDGIGSGMFYECPLEELYLGRNLEYNKNSSYGYSPFIYMNRLKSVTIGNSVTSIDEYLFSYCVNMVSVLIPNSVLSIGMYAFYDCKKLTSISLPDGVNHIDEGVFSGCSSLLSIDIPYSVTVISDYAFEKCSSLIGINIPKSVNSIGNFVFSGCTSLKEITFEDAEEVLTLGYNKYNNTGIGQGLFYDCPLEKVSLGRNLSYRKNSSYGYSPFINIKSLKYLTIGDYVTTIGEYLFSNCVGLVEIRIPSNVISIKSCAFYSCKGLNTISISEGVTSIGNYTFENCRNLQVTTIPQSITSIGDSVFTGCTGELVVKCNIPNGAFCGSKFAKVHIGEHVSSIGDSSFKGCSSLTSLSVPNNVTFIGNSAFQDCSGLTSLAMGEGLTSIGDSSFKGCSSLTSLSVPNNVTFIGNSAFSGCSALTSITIPQSVTEIGSSAFDNCTSIKELVIADGRELLSIGCNASNEGLFHDCPLRKIYIGRNLNNAYEFSPFPINVKLLSLTFGNNVTSISNYMLYGVYVLTSVTIPDNVVSIGDYAFSNFNTARIITIPNSVISIGKSSFENCKGELVVECNIPNSAFSNAKFSTVSIGAKVVSIGTSALENCVNLTSISIPNNVRSISNSVFSGCSSLKEVIIQDSRETLSLGSNSYNKSNTGEGLFSASPLEYVYLGRNLSYEPEKSYGYSPFYNKDKITNVFIGENVTEINRYAFLDCDNLHSLTIGNGVLFINDNAFSSPDKVVWLANTPPKGYVNVKGRINYVSNGQYSELENVIVYPYLSSMFEVDGVKYVPIAPSEHTCDVVDCAYNSTAAVINVGEVVLHKGVEMNVKKIMPFAFLGNNYINKAVISHNGGIGEQAFYDCNGIKTLELSNFGNIGSESFRSCDALESAVVNNVANLSKNDMSANTVLEFNDWVSSNHDHSSASSENFNFSIMNEAMLSFNWSVSSEYDYDKLMVILDDIKILEKSGNVSGIYSIPISQGEHTLVVKYVKDLSNSSGADQASITNIVVAYSNDYVTNVFGVGNSAFYDCLSLNTVILGEDVISLGSEAFRGCKKLSGISIPKTLVRIGDWAFGGCSSLSDVTIVNRVEPLVLGSNASLSLFSDCPLESLYIGGKIVYNTSSDKGYSPFYRNTSLRIVVITDNEDQIYDNEFYGCTALKDVTIGNGVKSIGNYAFSGCSSLDKFSFGRNMQSIGEEAFSDCGNLTEIRSSAAVPPVCGTQALDDINKWNCVLRVPIGYQTAYMAADQWKEFFFIEDVVDGIDALSTENGQQTIDIYDLSGRRILVNDLRELPRGFYIVNGRKVLIGD